MGLGQVLADAVVGVDYLDPATRRLFNEFMSTVAGEEAAAAEAELASVPVAAVGPVNKGSKTGWVEEREADYSSRDPVQGVTPV